MIGVLDSGLGGLTVLKKLIHHFPKHNFTYIADQKNLPYGTKTRKELINILSYFLDYFSHADAIIIACNTLSGLITKKYIDTSKYPPIINTISNLTNELVNENIYHQSVGVLATTFTIELGEYRRLINLAQPSTIIYEQSAPLLVPAIESHSSELDQILKKYIDIFPKNLSYLILGCTHYNILEDKIQKILPNTVIINPYNSIINELLALNISTGQSSIKFLTSLYSQNFQMMSENLLNKSIKWETI